ncbi:response regulator [Azospirillum sp.]|uniref:response regulator n=1 Tax=Azospirillum sp. TaxID=34012 RepID=UPI002D4FE571|nr:response regulator [Azospirillum sp.]HYD71252.1 response regulator [Azospirillum sp.]
MKILIIEDEALIAMAYADALESAGYTVIGICCSLDQAQALTRDRAPDLALADLRLGQKRCGAKVDEWLHETFGTTSVYITANVDFAHKYRTYGIGYVEKPVGPVALVDVVDFLASVHRGESLPPTPRCLTLFADRMDAVRQKRRPVLREERGAATA